MLLVTCPTCGQKYALPKESAGTTKRCRQCQSTIQVPGQQSTVAEKPKKKKLVLRPPRRQRPVVWMAMGGMMTAFVMAAGHTLWHRKNPVETPQQLYQPISVGGDAQELNDAQRMYNKSMGAIVYIQKYREGLCRGHGSGFFLYPGDKIVTNYHVIADSDFALIETYWRQQFRVDKILAFDRERDLAVLPTPKSIKPHSVRLTERPHEIGERIFTIGSPQDVRFGISEGVIVAMGELLSSHRGALVQADISAAPGASGSPLLDRDGRVIGVVARGSPMERKYTYAVHSDELRKMLTQELIPTSFVQGL